MKRSELNLYRKKLNLTESIDNEVLYQTLKEQGLIQENLYQEQEMESDTSELFYDCLDPSAMDSMLTTLHSHLYYEILFICSGEIDYLLGAKRYHIERGTVLFIPPGTAHGPIFPEHMEEPYARYALWVAPARLERLRKMNGLYNLLRREACVLQCTSSIASELLFRCEQAVHEEEGQKYGWQVMHDCLCAELLVLMERLYAQGRFSKVHRMRNDLLDGILYYIESHVQDRITLESVAERFHVSESTISHLFSGQFHTSFYQYVIQMRLVAAKNLILDGCSMEETALRSGFSDYTAFYRAFKGSFGISPRQYRTRQLEMTHKQQ